MTQRLPFAPPMVTQLAGPRIIRVCHLPGLSRHELSEDTRRFTAHGQSVELRLPRLTPAQLQTVASHVRTVAQEQLATMSVMEIVNAIDRCVARMLDADHPARQEMETMLPVVSGFDPEITRLGMNACLKAFRRPQLLRFLAEDFGDPGILDEFRPRPRGGWARAYGPALLAHIWAGNVPGLPLWSLVAGLLVKAGNLGKVSSAETLFASWFAQTLAEVEPRLADALAVVWWPGGDAALEDLVCQQADVIKVYGSDTAVAAWQGRLAPGKRLLAHGHKISIALVARSALDTRQAELTARQAALDMVRWDQHGCYSPQVYYVERGGQIAPAEFARHLAGQLAALQHTFPRRELALEDSTAVAQWRLSIELAQLRGEPVELLGTKTSSWLLAYRDAAQPPQATSLNRTAHVMAVDALEEVMPLLKPVQSYLQTVGLAASPEVLFALAPQLAQAGACRICAVGSMTTPAPGWHHDGRFSLLDLVRMVDIDESVESAAETFSAYRD